MRSPLDRLNKEIAIKNHLEDRKAAKDGSGSKDMASLEIATLE